MLDSPLSRFVVTLLVVFPLTAILSPPDVFSQLFVAGMLVLLAYYLSYRGGYDAVLSD